MSNDGMTQRVVARVREAGGWPGGPQWTDDEESILSKLSTQSYDAAEKLRNELHRKLAELDRKVGNDRDKKEWIKGCRALIEKANGALNQIGYSARTTYDIRH
jgi:ElaB/YqjD/DUF883 family membrane-anchored ribosome-binding protein